MLTRELLTQLGHVMRPVRTQLANVAARAVIQLVNDSGSRQVVQIGAPETIPDAEHFQPYGFFSIPFPGAVGIAVFPAGDRSHPLVFAVADRRHRAIGGQPGECGLRTDEGDEIRLARGHSMVFATSGTIKQGSASAAQKAVLGTQRDTAEQTFLTALAAFVTALGGLPGMSGPAATFQAAITTFASAVTAALSAKVTLE